MSNIIRQSVLSTLLLVWGFSTAAGDDGKDTVAYSSILDPQDKYHLTWHFTGTEGYDEITFKLEVETTGWVGLGFSPKGSMAGADIIIAWVDKNNKGHLKDMMAERNGLPTTDKIQEVNLISAAEFDGKTIIEFSRRLDTCDDEDLPLKTDTTRLIYAYGSTDPPTENITSSEYHGSTTRGSKSVYLFDPQSPIEDLPANSMKYEVKMPQYVVPSTVTTYYCSFHAAPTLPTKHHVIAVEPIITEGNEGLVHHMILYGCWNVTQEHIRNSDKKDGICFTAEMPEFAQYCASVIYGWAVGGGGYAYPEDLGYPLGGEGSPEYFMLQLHYDNPAKAEGKVDSSGVRLIYTPDLRDIDVGLASLGATVGLMIPPKVNSFEVTSYCHSSCTKQWIPPEGITIISYMLHAHLLGAKITIDVYKPDGTSEVFASDNSYDFNFQETRLFSEPKKVAPGDTLKLTCTMDSSKRAELTLGGEATTEEMCFAFITYYPVANISHCGSILGYYVNPFSDLYSLEAEGATGVLYPNEEFTVDLNKSLENVKWTADKVKKAQGIVRRVPHVDLCIGIDGKNLTNYPIYNITEFKEVDKMEDVSVCVSSASRISQIYLVATLLSFITAAFA